MRGDFTEELADDALRETVRLDAARERELAQARGEIPVAADDALEQSRVCEVVEPALGAIALAGGVTSVRPVGELSFLKRASSAAVSASG